MIGLVWSATLERVSHERSLAIASKIQVNSDFAHLLLQQIDASLLSIEQLLRVISHLDLSGTPKVQIDGLMEHFEMTHDQFELAGISDENGNVIISGKPVKFFKSGIYQEEFGFHQTHNDDRLLIGKPVPDPLHRDDALIPVSLRINKQHGAFGGIVYACIRQSYVAALEENQLGEKSDFHLIGTNGIVYLRKGVGEAEPHSDQWNRSVLMAQSKKRNGNLILQEKPDEGLELLSYRTSHKYPLILAFATPESDALVGFHKREHIYYLVAVLLSLFIIAIAAGLAAFIFWQKRAHQLLKESKERYQAAFIASPDAVNINRLSDGLYLEINDAFSRLTGFVLNDVIGKTSREINIWRNMNDRQRLVDALQREGYCENLEADFCAKDGRVIRALMSASVITLDGQLCILSVTRDITERKSAEAQIHQLTQIYAALSQCNQAIVHCTSEEELFPLICSIAVQFGGMKMAWIGLVDEEGQRVKIVTSHGENQRSQDYLSYLTDRGISLAPDNSEPRGPTGRAILTQQPFFCQDYLNDPQTTAWREQAASYGLYATAALPLFRGGTAIGALTIYADDDGTEAFTEQIRKLLLEMASDISFALDNFARDESHAKAERLLAESEERLRLTTEMAGIASWEYDLVANRMDRSANHDQLYGLPWQERWSIDTFLRVTHPDDRELSNKIINASIAPAGPDHYAFDFRATWPDGGVHWLWANGQVVKRDSSGRGLLVRGVLIDITERKIAEAKIQHLTNLYTALSQCNQAIVSSTSETELFDRVCRIAVQTGGMSMAWIGLVDESRQHMTAAAAHGKGLDFLHETITLIVLDDPGQRGVVGWALNKDRPVWSQDYQHDSRTTAWHKAARKFGWQSAGSLPLRKEGLTIGALTLFSDVPNTFTEQVKGLLIEMATDISHALGNFAREAERNEREQKLSSLSRAVEQSPGSIIITDLAGNIQYVNPVFERVTGYTTAEIIGQNPRLFQSGETPAEVYQELWATIMSGKTWHGEFHNRRKDGTLFWELTSIAPIFNRQGEATGYVATKEDITGRKAAEDEIQRLAFSDPLTQLPNRRLLTDRLKQALAASGRNSSSGALLFIDLDDFKTLNDTLGHNVGDLLLQQVAQRLVTCVREGDTVARFGGDEFVIMLEDLSATANEAAAQAETVGEKVLVELNRPYDLAGHEYTGTPSIGVTLFADQDDSIEELFKRADLAMYQAKSSGHNNLRFYDPDLQAMLMARASLETELHRAIQEDQFCLYYQPQVDSEGRVTGAEALVRWQHPARGIVSPAEFIPLAEETGLILPLGYRVLEKACRQLTDWSVQPEMAQLSLAVNVSARQFHHKGFVDLVLAVLALTGADPRKLKLELTESLLLDDVDAVIENMNALKTRGVSFSLDDFGTGYSSLAYLKRLPLYQLKIDQSFVRDILVDPNDSAIAKMIVALAQSMGLEVIAEGVETVDQKDLLARQGCHAYQGYLYSRPLPLEEFEEYVKQA